MKSTSVSGGDHSSPELVSDSALESPDRDRLDRAEFAKSIARSILNLGAEAPFVIGIHGPAGAGKSTVLNFIRYYLSQPARLGAGGLAADPLLLVPFNPSWFPDHRQIAAQFFCQLQAAIAVSKSAEGLRTAAAGMEQLAAAIQGSAPSDLFTIRQELATLLRRQDSRVLVLVDDVDRLEPEGVIELFKLTAAAGLPRFIFLLSCDRDVVERLLAAARVPDPEAYLGKFIQLPFDVPEPDKFTLRQMLSASIGELHAGAPAELYSEADWDQLFWQGLDPLIAGPRDLNRFVNALRSTYAPIRQEVNFVDFSAVQAIRLFAPGMYRFLIANKPTLTGAPQKVELNEKQARAARIESMSRALQGVAEAKRAAVDHMLQCIFPEWETGLSSQRRRAAARARLERRVSSPDVFDLYFNPNIPAGSLTRTEIRSVLDLALDSNLFTARLQELAAEPARGGKSRLDLFLEHMQDYTRDEIPIAHIPSILQTIFDAGDQFCSKIEPEPIPSRRNDNQLLQIAAQLLSRLPDEETRADLLRNQLPEARAIYMALRFVLRIDPGSSRDAAGWSADTANLLRPIVLDRIRAAAADGSLAAVPYLDVVFNAWETWSAPEEPAAFAAQLAAADEGVAGLLVGALKPLTPGESQFLSNPEFLHRWAALDMAELVPKCREWLKARPTWMTDVRRVAIEAFVNAVGNAAIA